MLTLFGFALRDVTDVSVSSLCVTDVFVLPRDQFRVPLRVHVTVGGHGCATHVRELRSRTGRDCIRHVDESV